MNSENTYTIKRTLMLIATIAAGLFACIALLVALGLTQNIDTAVLQAIHANSSPLLDTIVPIVTYKGEPVIVVAVAVVLSLLLMYKRRWTAATIVAGSVVGAASVNYIVKTIAVRARPELWERLVHETGYSFPSAHATASAALALAIVAILWYTRWRWLSVAIGAVYVLGIGFTRLYLGVHYTSDVLAGWCMAVAWVACIIVFALAPEQREQRQ